MLSFISAGGMTAVCGQMVNTSAQTEILSTSVGTTPIHCGPSTSCVPNLNASFLCEHRQKLQSAMETLEIVSWSPFLHVDDDLLQCSINYSANCPLCLGAFDNSRELHLM